MFVTIKRPAVRLTALTFAILFAQTGHLMASVVIDFSPDSTGATSSLSDFASYFDHQIIGDRFTLTADTTITGGSIFSSVAGGTHGGGTVGDEMMFMVFEDVGGIPSNTPIVSVLTQLDVIDTAYATSIANVFRKHVTISPTLLSAGTYWFAMPGKTANVYWAGGSPAYDDGEFRRDPGPGTNNLETGVFLNKDLIFQLEGFTTAAIPEPSSLVVFCGLGLCGILMEISRRAISGSIENSTSVLMCRQITSRSTI